jgi:hypothetical protein
VHQHVDPAGRFAAATDGSEVTPNRSCCAAGRSARSSTRQVMATTPSPWPANPAPDATGRQSRAQAAWLLHLANHQLELFPAALGIAQETAKKRDLVSQHRFQAWLRIRQTIRQEHADALILIRAGRQRGPVLYRPARRIALDAGSGYDESSAVRSTSTA